MRKQQKKNLIYSLVILAVLFVVAGVVGGVTTNIKITSENINAEIQYSSEKEPDRKSVV